MEIDVEYVIRLMLHMCTKYVQHYVTLRIKTLNKNQVSLADKLTRMWLQAMAKIFKQLLTEVFHYQNKRKSMNDLIIMFKINQTQCHVWMIGCSLHVLFSEKTLFSNCIIQPIIIFSYHHRLLLVIRNKIRFMMHIWQQTINYNYLVLQGFPFCII